MKKLINLLIFSSLVFACAATAVAQGGRLDTAETRRRIAERQRAIEDPANNPFKTAPYDPLKPLKTQPPTFRATIELNAVGVVDGDTLIITNTANQRLLVRLQGIDAPEAAQFAFNEALEKLATLVTGKAVAIEFEPKGKPDSEGRVIAKVYLDGNDIGLEQIKAGFAWYSKEYKKEMSESDRYNYAEAEKDARSARKGLWRNASQLPPWDYRKR